MATKKTQRWAILVIMIVMIVGTLGSFAAMILSQQSSTQLAGDLQRATATYTKEQKAYQAKVDAQSKELSKKYYSTFTQFSDRVAKYDIDSVKSLTTDDLLVGDGAKIDGTTGFSAYYIGWDANANIFDQSVDTEAKTLKAPLSVATGLNNASLIEGWKTGMKGMRIGGVRLITIPSDQAYAEQGSTDQTTGKVVIAPNMPLKFIVMAISSPEEIPQPEALTKATQDYYEAYAAANGTQ